MKQKTFLYKCLCILGLFLSFLIILLHAIEGSDERLLFIKRQSSSVSGEILQWLILAAALLFIGFGAPVWIGFVLMGLVIVKLFIEFLLTTYYQDKY